MHGHVILGPVVQNFVSLMLSLSPEFVNYILTSEANTLLFLLKKCEDSHIFSTKNNGVFVIFMFEILTNCEITTSLVLNNWPLMYIKSDKL